MIFSRKCDIHINLPGLWILNTSLIRKNHEGEWSKIKYIRGFNVEVGEDETEREDFEGLLVLLLPLRLNNSSSCTMLCAEKEEEEDLKIT